MQRFSGFKTYAVQQAMREKLTDGGGNIRPFADFRTDALAVNQRYNVDYLRTEYETAVASAQMASKWSDFAPGALLRYDTAGDDHVRHEHAVYDGITRPKDDPFWDTTYPPCDWGCRCSVTEVDDDAAVTPAHELAGLPEVPEEFRPNVGKTGEVFGPEHPYFEVPGQVAAKIETQLPAAAPSQAEAQYEADVSEVFKPGTGMNLARNRVKENAQYAQALPALSLEQKTVVHHYTGNGYQVLNQTLRGQRPMTPFVEGYARLLNGALDKMPAFQGIVYRGTELAPELLKNYRAGAVITETAFTSASSLRRGAFEGNTLFRVESIAGRSVEQLSGLPAEAEVLFKTNTQFKVLKKEKTGGLTTIYLREIPVP